MLGPGTRNSRPEATKPSESMHQPEPVLLEVAAELPPQHRDGGRLVDVVGVEQAGAALPAEMPEQPLLGDALGHPAHRAWP